MQEGEVININKKDLESKTESRSVEDIRKEYTQFCNSVGQIEYQIEVLKRDKNAILSRMSQLNVEAAEAAKEQSNG